MARGYLATLLNGLPADIRPILVQAFDYVEDSWRFGDGVRASNAQLYKFEGTTSSSANTEFSIQHGNGQIPTKLLPVLDLTTIGSQVVPLTVTRAPDAQRIYLSSPTTNASIQVYAEF